MRKIVLTVFMLFVVLAIVLPSVSAQEFGCAVPAPKKLFYEVYLLNEYPNDIDLKTFKLNDAKEGYLLHGSNLLIDLDKRRLTMRLREIIKLPLPESPVKIISETIATISLVPSWHTVVVIDEDRAAHAHETYVTIYGLKDNKYQLILPRAKQSK